MFRNNRFLLPHRRTLWRIVAALMLNCPTFACHSNALPDVANETARRKESALAFIKSVVDGADRESLTARELEKNPSLFAVVKEKREALVTKIEAKTNLHLISRVEIWERVDPAGRVQSQFISIEFNFSKDGNRREFLQDCVSGWDVRNLLSKTWLPDLVINPYRVRYFKRFGNFAYSIYSTPGFSENENDCLRGLTIHYQPE